VKSLPHFQMAYAAKVFSLLIQEDTFNNFHAVISTLCEEIRTKERIPSLAYDSYKPGDPVFFGDMQDTVLKNLVLLLDDPDTHPLPCIIKKLEPLFLHADPQDPNAEARLFAALHATKVGFTDLLFILNLTEIKLVDSGDIDGVGLDELKDWALKYLSHPRGKKSNQSVA